ncbi:hypothetical protein D046_7222, partial [Vibrio parahaemolyticus V-223/04]
MSKQNVAVAKTQVNFTHLS